MSSDEELEIPDFDQCLSDSEGESMKKKNDGVKSRKNNLENASSNKKNFEKSNKNHVTKASSPIKQPSSKSSSDAPNSNVKSKFVICKFCDQDLTRWKLTAEKFQKHLDECEAKKHLHQFIRKNNTGVFRCQFCPKANVKYTTMLKHVEENHTESTVSHKNIYKSSLFRNLSKAFKSTFLQKKSRCLQPVYRKIFTTVFLYF